MQAINDDAGDRFPATRVKPSIGRHEAAIAAIAQHPSASDQVTKLRAELAVRRPAFSNARFAEENRCDRSMRGAHCDAIQCLE